jgi:hypothetical protein
MNITRYGGVSSGHPKDRRFERGAEARVKGELKTAEPDRSRAPVLSKSLTWTAFQLRMSHFPLW